MYSRELEELIEAILADGVITDQERKVLHNRAFAEGVSIEEIDVVINGKLAMRQQEIRNRNMGVAPAQTPAPAPTPPPMARGGQPSNKYGSVLKCPNCGANVTAGTPKCNSCGVSFHGVGANSSIETLAYQLRHVNIDDDDNGVVSVGIITNFPVPTTKADLLEFILYTHSKVDKGIGFTDSQREQAITKAFRVKYDECIDKAKFYFADDPQFKPLFEQHEKVQKNTWKQMTPFSKFTTIGCGCLVVFIILFFLVGLLAS